MKNVIFIPILLVIGYLMFTETTPPTTYVNPMIGTGGHGHTFPGATVPFGMVQLSPDTRIDGSWDGCSGYHYSDSVIYGFSHTHLSGTGCSDYGDIMLMPVKGQPVFDNKAYSSHFSHANETAAPCFYKVKLDKDNIEVELTATTRVGFHKYTFNHIGEASVILDLTHRDKLLEGNINVVDDKTIEVFRRSEAWAKDQYIYARIEFSKPVKTTKTTSGDKAAFTFDVKNKEQVFVKVAISNVSTQGAKLNMQAELPEWDFDAVKKAADSSWNKELGKIEVTSSDNKKLQTFYTALYHTMIQPNVAMDVDSSYRGRDNKIHKAKDFTYYSVFSLWDTFRAAHPLYTIIDRKRTSDFIQTFLAQYKEGGRLPVWELASNETDCMIGYHSVSVIADAAGKGITNFDTNLALEAMKKSATWNHLGLPAYIDHGYLSMDDESECVSKTLEYAYDDWCIAQMAHLLNKKEDEEKYSKRSQSWKNVFDTQTGFMRPKKNGGWLTPFEPREVNNNFTEGNAWQYTFFVPQDIDGLIKKMGGKDKFEKKLDELFTTSSKTTGREQADISGLIGQYAHGNEPSHHMAYLYDYVQNPSKTQARIHQIMSDFYKPAPDGLIGNEDCGQMSAWYVLSALGIYQVTPGTDSYMFGTPLFKEAKVHLENGKTFTILAKQVSDQNFYIQSATLDAKEYKNAFISYADILKGTTLGFEMVASASAKSQLSPPASSPVTTPLVVVPTIQAPSKVFRDKMQVELKSTYPDATIYYSTDGSKPTSASLRYTSPIDLTITTTVNAVNVTREGKQSFFSTGTFYKMPHNWKVNILSKYNPQYTAGGDEGLIDGIRGDIDWRKGEWQGYQGQNFEAIVDMMTPQTVHLLSAGFLQDSRSWILMPSKIEYYSSNDNKNFELITSLTNNQIKPEDYEVQKLDFGFGIDHPVTTRYIKIVAYNYGKLPQWHQGAGGDAFIFTDEIVIK